jgi:hypothetical protein
MVRPFRLDRRARIERRGAGTPSPISTRHAALVVIDLQHAFMNEAVGWAAVPAARDTVPRSTAWRRCARPAAASFDQNDP